MSRLCIGQETRESRSWAQQSARLSTTNVVPTVAAEVRSEAQWRIDGGGPVTATGSRTPAGEGGRLMAILHREAFEELAKE